MKTRYIGLCLFIVGLLSACSEEDWVKNEQTEQSVQIKVQAHSGNKEASVSRLAYEDSETTGEGVTVTWSANDAFYLKGETSGAHGQMNIIEKETDYTADEVFYGVLSKALSNGESVTAYYPTVAYDVEKNLFNVDVRKATQKADAPMAHLSATNYMIGTGHADGEEVSVDFSEGNKVAIIRLDLTIPAQSQSIGIKELHIESGNLHTIGTLDTDNGEFIEDAFFEKHRQIVYLEGYAAGASATQLQVYATMLPTALNEKMLLKVLLANGNVYSSEVNFSSGTSVIACNRYYIIKETSPLIELDYTWYTSLGANSSYYEITNESQLFAFANIVNGTAPVAKDNFSGKTVTLNKDITLNMDWTPIGASYSESGDFSFRGTFDGGGHTISNVKLYMEVPSNVEYNKFPCGFFANAIGATIKNLTLQGDGLLESAKKSGTGKFYLGGLVGYAENTDIENCRNEMNLSAYHVVSWLYMGGLIGYLKNGSVKVCSNAGDVMAVSVSSPYMGGIIGDGETDVVVASFTEAVNITSTNTSSISCLGGIVGRLQYASTLVASYSLVNNISSDTKADKSVGCLAGSLGNEGLDKSAKVYGCYAVSQLVPSTKYYNGVGNVNVGTDVKSETHLETLNNGIATWNATLSGVLEEAYCRYSYKVGDTHLVLEKTTNIHSGELDDMGNGGEIGNASAK